MVLFTVIIIYLILGLLYINMYSNIIKWIVENDRSKIDKKLLLVLTTVYMVIYFPIMIYKILKKDIEQERNRRKKFKQYPKV